MADESPWAKDLGYLERFIAKLEAQAGTLPGDRREQALRLLGEERERWASIMAVLAGGPVAAGSAGGAGPLPTPVGRRWQGLTVGSLIGQP